MWLNKKSTRWVLFLFWSELFGDIVEAVEMVEAHCRKLSATLCDVCFRIVIWNVGQTDGYILLFPVGGKPMEVVNNLTVVCRSISAIDVWIHILDVNNVVVDVGSHRLKMSAVDIQRRLHVSTPSRWFQFAETDYFVASQQGFAASEGDTTVRRLKVKVIHHNLIHYFLYIHLPPHTISPEALLIKTILTAQRTAMECHQRGDTLSVRSKAVTTDSYQRGLHVIR